MASFNIGDYRLFHQGISRANFEQPGQVVTHLGAIQAQDYSGALWAIGLRMRTATPSTVEQAIRDRTIVRTWPMRGTLHFVAAANVRWMLKLLTPRVISGSAARRRELEIDDVVLGRSRELLGRALQGGRQLTRAEIYKTLERGGVNPAGQRGIHIIGQLAQEAWLCFGPYLDKQPTFVLLDEWLPPYPELPRDEALAKLALTYFVGHGPATLPDLERWAGLKASDARAGLEAVKSQLRREEVEGQVYWLSPAEPDLPAGQQIFLLPGFDEFILGYKDRRAALDPQYSQRIVPGGNGVFRPTLIINGRVAGTWRRAVKKGKLIISVDLFDSSLRPDPAALSSAAAHYGRYMEMPVELAGVSIAGP